ncbi:hypothetical protein BKA70DRAFT_1263735 [Coprinopsis sp. MPI-PUGE-AT-0042]|nr:hypothetical protein BKA70DRAFT_1263735 [Coprinopsis sp. MPI-PUGE-AT-0042]
MLPDSRLVPFISSNDPFPSYLTNHLQAHLGSLDKRIGEFNATLSRLEAEFQRLKTELQVTRAERNKLAEEKHQYRHVNAAVRRLPPEVVALILRYALTSRFGVARGRGRALEKPDREYFAGLRSVSRLWRTTAMTTPDLWRYLYVVPEFGFSFGMSPTQLASRLRAWFLRGGTNAEVMLLISGWGRALHDPMDMFACLDQPGLNFGTISLGGANDSRDRVLPLLQPIDAFKRTRNASLEWGSNGLSRDEPAWISFSDIFPRLESLALHVEFPLRIVFPQQHLICLHLNNGPFYKLYELASLLPSAPCLQELILRFDKLRPRWERYAYKSRHYDNDSDSCTDENEFDKKNRRSPVTHPSVKRLIISCALPIRMFAAFTFPSLELFRVVGPMRNIDTTFTHLREFIGRSNGTNLTLDLSRAFLKTVDLYSLLVSIPTLHALFLDNPHPLFSPSTEDYSSYATPPPTQIETIVFTSTYFKGTPSFGTWSGIMASRFDMKRARTNVYFFKGAEAVESVDLGALMFSGVDGDAIYALTDGKFPLRSHDVLGMHYYPDEEKDDEDEDDSDGSW